MDTRFIFHTIDQLCKFIEASGYRGYDPYDALSSPFLLWVARRNPSAGRFLISAFRFSPFNLRSFFSIRPEADAKAIALMARGYFLLGDILKKEKYWALGTECLKILEKISISGFSGMCWAHPFSYCSRRGFIPANFPTVISTVYAAQAFLDGYERVGEKQWLKVARSACNFILKDLSRVSSPTSFFFTYYPGSNLPVHNANLLAVELFVRVACLRDEKSLLESALSALDYTLSDQKPDGSWLYDGPESRFRESSFVDGFHTGFVLESLWNIHNWIGGVDINLKNPISRGVSFYLTHLLNPNGQPYRFVNRLWPLDLRDCAEAIIVLSKLRGISTEIRIMCDRVFRWTMENMYSPRGYFYAFRWNKFVTRIPYIRFQAWMLIAISTFFYENK